MFVVFVGLRWFGCLLFVVCCLLFVVCCLLFVVVVVVVVVVGCGGGCLSLFVVGISNTQFSVRRKTMLIPRTRTYQMKTRKQRSKKSMKRNYLKSSFTVETRKYSLK
jgi:hypothetical protein